MNARSFISKLEFLFMFFLLFSFLFIFINEEKKSIPTSATNEFFVDLNYGAPQGNDDGKEPVFDGTTMSEPWSHIDDIDWGYISTVTKPVYIYVFADTNNTTDTLTNSINPSYNGTPIDDVIFIGVKSSTDSPYWPGHTPLPLSYPKFQAPSSDYAVELNGNTGIEFKNFEFTGYSGVTTASVINSSSVIQFNSCKITSTDDAEALYVHDSESIDLCFCSFIGDDAPNSSLINFEESLYILMYDCETTVSDKCENIVYFNDCENGDIRRNKFHIGSSAECAYGILIEYSEYFNFSSNSVYGSCSQSAVSDDATNYGNFQWNCNTIYNTFSSVSDYGRGYYGCRTECENIMSFQNNILIASDPDQGYAIYIDYAIGDWQPIPSKFQYNCYYNANSGDIAHCSIDNYDITELTNWHNDTNDSDSVFVDPDLDSGYKIKPSSPASVLSGGIHVSGVYFDIDREMIPVTGSISRGCDLYINISYSALGAIYSAGTVSIGTVTSPFTFQMGITNSMGFDITITNIAITGGSGYFSCGYPTLPFTIGASTTTYLDCVFIGIGSTTETLSITYDTGYSTYTEQITLTGTGT